MGSSDSHPQVVVKTPKKRTRQTIIHATDALIHWVMAQGWRDPVRVLLVAAARLWRRRHEEGFADRAWRAWAEVMKWEQDEP